MKNAAYRITRSGTVYFRICLMFNSGVRARRRGNTLIEVSGMKENGDGAARTFTLHPEHLLCMSYHIRCVHIRCDCGRPCVHVLHVCLVCMLYLCAVFYDYD